MSFSTVEIEGKKAAPDRVYYNGTVINNTLKTTKATEDPIVVFQDQRQTPLVPDGSKYEVSVQNFSLNGCQKTLPLFIPQVSPPIVNKPLSSAFVQVLTTDDVGNPLTSTITYSCSANVISPGNIITAITGFISNVILNCTDVLCISANSTSFTVNAPYGCNLPTGTYTPSSGNARYYDPTDVTTTIYSVQVGIYTGSGTSPTNYKLSAPTYIVWEPENKAPYIPVPKTAQPTQQETEYYYCYTYTHWVELVNKALNTAWTSVKTGVGTQCPFIEYDQTTGLVALNQDSKTCMVPVGTSLPAPFSVTYTASGSYQAGEYSFVGMNTCLELLLTNFSAMYFGYNSVLWNAQTGIYLPEVVIDTGLTVSLVAGTSSNKTPVGDTLRSLPKSSIVQLANPFSGAALADAFFVRLPQDYVSTGSVWSPVSSIVLVTSQIPVRNEAAANPILFGTANVGGQSASGGAFQQVLIEAPIDATKADFWRGSIVYQPQTLTFSSLSSSQEGISNVDVSLFWRNRLTNSLVPLNIPSQGSMSFRLLFKKKLVL
jgi:hypothetical protein